MSNPVTDARNAQQLANRQLDAIRRAKRDASTQTASDVLRSVLEQATQPTWVERPNGQ